jgi:hypothetical protein
MSHESALYLELPGRQIPMLGYGEGVNKHSAGENWASDISRLGAWDWNGPHCVCTYHIPLDSNRPNNCACHV